MGKLFPKPHQTRAITDNIYGQKGLVNADRAMFISACATGKTLTGLWSVEEHLFSHVHNEHKIAVFFFPSLALISQTYDTFFTQTSIKGYNPLVVCSETKIGQTAEDPEETPDDSIVYETCTNIENTKAYLSDLNIKTKVIFVTYHSAPIVGNALLALGLEADIGSFDEAHRTAQQGDTQNMSYALLNENFPIRKRLFMTATPKHIASSEEDEKAEFSMDNIDVYGEVAHELPMRQAINEGLICDYSIIAGAMESSEEIDDENGVSVIAEAFIRGIKKTGVKTAIAFQKNIAISKAFAQWVATHYPDIQIRHIDGTMSHGERESVMQFLREGDGVRIVTNSKILSEGVDAPAVDMVGFLSNAASEIDIVQRVGRVQRLLAGFPNKIGYVFIPIITNYQKEIIYGEKNLLNIIANLRENDEQLRVLSSLNQSAEKKLPQIQVVLLSGDEMNHEMKNCESFLPKLFNKINTVVIGGNINNYFSAWETTCEKVENIYKQTGNIPKTATARMSEEDRFAGNWVHSQRAAYKLGLLSVEKIKILEEKFNGEFFLDKEDQWIGNLSKVLKVIEKTGKKPKKGTPLGNWIRTQRKYYNSGCLPDQQKEILIENLGPSFFIEDMDSYYEEQWQGGFADARNFFINNGRIPINSDDSLQYGKAWIWCKTQRNYHKQGKLSKDKIALLKKTFGKMFFDPEKALFLFKTREMMHYLKEHNHYPGLKDESSLYTWRARIIKMYGIEKMGLDRVKILRRLFGPSFLSRGVKCY